MFYWTKLGRSLGTEKLDNHVTKSSKFKAGTSFFVGDWSNLVLCLFEVGNYLNTEVRQINFTLLVIQDLAYKVYHTQRLLLGLLSSIRAGGIINVKMGVEILTSGSGILHFSPGPRRQFMYCKAVQNNCPFTLCSNVFKDLIVF